MLKLFAKSIDHKELANRLNEYVVKRNATYDGIAKQLRISVDSLRSFRRELANEEFEQLTTYYQERARVMDDFLVQAERTNGKTTIGHTSNGKVTHAQKTYVKATDGKTTNAEVECNPYDMLVKVIKSLFEMSRQFKPILEEKIHLKEKVKELDNKHKKREATLINEI